MDKAKQTRDFFDFEWNMELKAGVDRVSWNRFWEETGKIFLPFTTIDEGRFL